MSDALAVERLVKSFGKHTVLKGIDLTVGEHEVIALIGASGSGKSTLLRCINLLEPIDSGRIFLDGSDITRPRNVNAVRRRIGIVFQAYNLFPHMSVLRNVTLAPRDVLQVIGELAAGGMTMIIATHEMSFARDIANRVCFLDGGTIIEEGAPDQIFTTPREPRTQQFLERIIEAKRL